MAPLHGIIPILSCKYHVVTFCMPKVVKAPGIQLEKYKRSFDKRKKALFIHY